MMTALATPPSTDFVLADFGGDARLDALLEALPQESDVPVILVRPGGQAIGGGYHITEVKAGAFVTLDCGGNPDRWNETILQVEDLPLRPGQRPMTIGKLRSILETVARRIELAGDARLTVEAGPPGAAMEIFDIASLSVGADAAVLELAARSSLCKPRHRAEMAEKASCCASSGQSRCCA